MMTALADPMSGFDLPAALAHVTEVVRRSGSSFTLGMRILPRPQRMAMYAIYAFGREVDDVADEGGEPAAKLVALEEWRNEVERLYAANPTRPTSRALLEPVVTYSLPKEEFLGLIDGMEMDTRDIRAPDLATLRLYCRRVAGTVGLLSLRVFGATEPQAPEFALALADGLQFTNILRDLAEDAARGRLYLPRELLLRHGLNAEADPEALIRDPRLSGVCADMAAMARQRFADADRYLAGCARHRLRPALLMMGIYIDTLERLSRRGWPAGCPPLAKVAKLAKLRAALVHGLFRPSWQPST
jgi:phytoene synthase